MSVAHGLTQVPETGLHFDSGEPAQVESEKHCTHTEKVGSQSGVSKLVRQSLSELQGTPARPPASCRALASAASSKKTSEA